MEKLRLFFVVLTSVTEMDTRLVYIAHCNSKILCHGTLMLLKTRTAKKMFFKYLTEQKKQEK